MRFYLHFYNGFRLFSSGCLIFEVKKKTNSISKIRYNIAFQGIYKKFVILNSSSKDVVNKKKKLGETFHFILSFLEVYNEHT